MMLANMKMCLVTESNAGVPVTPMLGTRSLHRPNVGSLEIGNALPSRVAQICAPVPALSPYTQSLSVATMTVEPSTSGWAYTEPSTAAVHRDADENVLTIEGLKFGSAESQPLRSTFSDAVPSSACATAVVPSTTPSNIGSTLATTVSPVAARASRLAECRRFLRLCTGGPQKVPLQ